MAHSEPTPLDRIGNNQPLCEPGSDCDCGPQVPPAQMMSWPAITGIVATGLILCISVWNLLGV